MFFLFCLWFLKNCLLSQGQQPANSYAEQECSLFPSSSTRRLIRQGSSELVTLNHFHRRETNANKMQFLSSGVSARCSAIKLNYRVELKPSSLRSQRDATLQKIGHRSSKISHSCLFASGYAEDWNVRSVDTCLRIPQLTCDIVGFLPMPCVCTWSWGGQLAWALASASMDTRAASGHLWGLPPPSSSKPLPPGAAPPWAIGKCETGWKWGFSEEQESPVCFCVGLWGWDVLPLCFQY